MIVHTYSVLHHMSEASRVSRLKSKNKSSKVTVKTQS